jgi:hypothetical protein
MSSINPFSEAPMFDWLDDIPELGVPGVPGVPPQKSAGFSGTPAKTAGVPRCSTDHAKMPRNPPVLPVEHREHTKHRTEAQARALLRDWHERIEGLDFNTAPAGMTLLRWRELVSDARWIYENHASQLAREGWSSHDVFGVLPWRPGGGVLLDRLQGARDLRLDGQGRAIWQSWSVTFVTCRGAAGPMMASGLVLAWDCKPAANSGG